jgi:hypothetical protein
MAHKRSLNWFFVHNPKQLTSSLKSSILVPPLPFSSYYKLAYSGSSTTTPELYLRSLAYRSKILEVSSGVISTTGASFSSSYLRTS